MLFDFKRLVLVLSITALSALAADKDKRFDPGLLSGFKAQQTNQKVTIAARVYESDEETKPAFGKNNPYKYGVLPVLVMIQNGGSQALSVDRIKVEYVGIDRQHVEATPAADLRFIKGARKPNVAIGPT